MTDRIALPQRSSGDTEGDVQRVLSKLEASGRNLTITRLVANSTNVFRPFILMSDALMMRAALPARARELAILALADERQSRYEWVEHLPISAASGVTVTEQNEIAAGTTDRSPTLSPTDKLAVTAARRLARGEPIDQLWPDMTAAWGTEGALDLIFTAAWWGGYVPTVIAALGLTEDDVVTPPGPPAPK